ncbi:MAG: RsmD family RNA methyltransferase [Verrucomicrobia bacterium]|nr:RsmD family RNA methyltransferase [Verrucomicrobiota bacterium]MDA1065606.1 RsmD family RNA methyltransferase [Verrucomicrobiota bacterium]
MRITGGKARGIQLVSPTGQKTRPAADVLREALFSSLGNEVKGVRFADLFAGTGAYGLEAWSRGAAEGVFVESDRHCARCMTENIARVAKSAGVSPSSVSFIRSDVFKWSSFHPKSFDIVFADPPYRLYPNIIAELFRIGRDLLCPDGTLVIEKPASVTMASEGWMLIKQLGKARGDGPSLAIFKPDSQLHITSKD